MGINPRGDLRGGPRPVRSACPRMGHFLPTLDPRSGPQDVSGPRSAGGLRHRARHASGTRAWQAAGPGGPWVSPVKGVRESA